jgi:hypothetical protein
MGFSKKFVGPTTRVEEARIGECGMWFTGGTHVLMWQYGNVQTRLAGNVLLWLQNGTTYRLEGSWTRVKCLPSRIRSPAKGRTTRPSRPKKKMR